MQNDRGIAWLLLALAGWLVQAQTTQGLIAGKVFDGDTKQPIAHAMVEYVRREQGRVVERGSIRTDEHGFYTFSFLTPGTYQVRVRVNENVLHVGDYQPQEIQQIELFVASRLELNFALRKLTDVWQAGIKEGLYENSSTAIVHYYAADVAQLRSAYLQLVPYRTSSLGATVSYVVDPASVENLPLAGRDIYTTLVLQPGVTADTSTARGLGLSVNGQRPSASNFLLDGLENNNALVTGPLAPIAPEAIQEYRFSTNNFSAEYGGTAGFVANAVTVRGGGDFHGVAYFYLKNDPLNANTFQHNRQNIPRVPDTEIQPGFRVSGPVLRNRLFFSAAFEHLRSRSYDEARDVRLPTQYLPLSLLDAPTSDARDLLSRYPSPLPTFSGQPQTLTVSLSPPVSVDRSLAIGRLDYSPSQNDHLMGRVLIARVARPDFIWSPYPDFVSRLDQDTLGLAVVHTRAFRPGLTNEARAGYSFDHLEWNRPHPEIPTLISRDQTVLPGSPAFYAYRNDSPTTEILDNLNLTGPRHAATVGAGLLLRRAEGFLTAGRDGAYEFGNAKAFGLDVPQFFRVAVTPGAGALRQPDFNRAYGYRQFHLFAQDAWRVSRRLSINYGVRYDNFGAPRNRGAAPDGRVLLGPGNSFTEQLSGARLDFSGPQALYRADNKDWAGRLGSSFDVFGNGRTVARAAYGIFYDRPFDNLWQNVRNNGFTLLSFEVPRQQESYLSPVSSVLPLYANLPRLNGFPTLTLLDPGLLSPYAQSWFAGVQQSLTGNLTLEVNGLGALGRRLITTDIVNRQFTTNSNSTGRPNPELPDIAYRANQGSSNYSALTVVSRYRSSNAQFQIAYTWSHTIDNQSDALAGDFFDLSFVRIPSGQSDARAAFSRQYDSRADRGNSDFDQRHNLVFFSYWNLPSPARDSRLAWAFRSWTVAQLAAFRSGSPYTVAGTNRADLGTGLIKNNRADILNPGLTGMSKAVPGGRLLLNPAGFGEPGIGQLGTSARNAFTGPGFYNIDLSLSRTFRVSRLGEGWRLQFRADAFNFLNHANLGNPDSFLGSQTFGVAQFGRRGRASGFPAVIPLNETPRQVQLLVRMEF